MTTIANSSAPRTTTTTASLDAPYTAAGDKELVQTLPVEDPAATLISGGECGRDHKALTQSLPVKTPAATLIRRGDVGTATAALVFPRSREQRTNAKNSRD